MSDNGCAFCRGETSARFDKDNQTGLTLEFTENETYIVAFGFNSSGKKTEIKLPIEYCPICARKLKDDKEQTKMKKHIEEMVYLAKRINPKRIAEGTHKNLKYYVLSLGTHPCAYIDVTDTKLCGVDYRNIDVKCHYGLTYSSSKLATVDESGWFIGWDYAHYCDYAGYEINYLQLQSGGKKWTTEEIVNECEEAIDSIVELLETDKGGEQE